MPRATVKKASKATTAGEPSALARMVAQAATTPAQKPATVPQVAPKGREGKVQRRIKVKWSNGAFAVVSIWQEDRPGTGVGYTDDYLLESKGQGFWLATKLDPCEKTTYTIFLGRVSGDAVSCSCKGFQGHGHCKHTAGIDALLSQGKLS